MESRSVNVIRNIRFSGINKIVSIVLPFVVRALFIRVIGSEIMGLNSLIISILQVLNLTELGFNDAVVFAMYKPVADGDRKTISEILYFYRKIYFLIGVIILVAGFCITPFLNYFITGSVPQEINIYLVFILYLFNTSISYMLFAYRGVLLTAHQRVDITSKVSILVKIFVNISQIIVIIVAKNVYVYVFMMLIGTVINNILIYITTNKLFPGIKAAGKLTKESRNSIFQKIKGLILYKLSMSTRNSFDSIYISTFVGLTATAIYNNYFYILGAVAVFTSVITESILPSVGNSIATEGQEKNYKDMNRINFIYLWIAGFSAISMLNLYQPFSEIAFGKENLFPFSIVIMFCIYYYVLRMGDVRAVYNDAHGLWWENRYRLVLESITNVILNYVLGKYFGVIGVVAATLISLFVFGFIGASYVLFKYYFTKYRLKEFLVFNLRSGLVTLIVAIITTLLCSLVNGNLIFVIIIRGIICVVSVNLLFYLFYHRSKQFKDVYIWIKSKIA